MSSLQERLHRNDVRDIAVKYAHLLCVSDYSKLLNNADALDEKDRRIEELEEQADIDKDFIRQYQAEVKRLKATRTIKLCAGCKELEAENGRLRLEFYHYENENTYKGNSIRHWHNKAQAYGTKMCEYKAHIEELEADNERLRAVYEAAKLTVEHIPFCDDHGLASAIAAALGKDDE